jgi:outer membrane protein assembly factor BamB
VNAATRDLSRAANAGTVTLLWHRQAGSGANMNIVAADGMVYASSSFQSDGDAEIYAIEAATGRPTWQARGLYPAAAGSGAVFGFDITGNTTSVVALSVATGRTAWRYSAGPFLEYTQASWMACSGEMVYVASGTTRLAAGLPTVRALDARTGRSVWAASLSSTAQYPALAGGVLYGCSAGRVVALHGTTGSQLWESAHIGGDMSALETADGVVFGNTVDTSTGTMSLFALDGTTGRQLWHGDDGWTLTASADGIVFLAVYSGSGTAALSAYYARSGKPAWARSLGNFGPLVASGDVLYIVNGAVMTALAATTGDTLWTYRLDHEVWWIVVDGGVVYACDAKGGVYALRV